MSERFKLDTSIDFNGRELLIELRGDYFPYERATKFQPSIDDRMELTEIIVRKYQNGNHGSYTEIDIIDLFTKEELEEFNEKLYANGEEIV